MVGGYYNDRANWAKRVPDIAVLSDRPLTAPLAVTLGLYCGGIQLGKAR